MIEYLTWEQLPTQLQMKYNPESVTQIIKEKNEIKIYFDDGELYTWRHMKQDEFSSIRSKWIKYS
jgi:alpha-tubulin suppressor-like RCC1 family protein